MQQASVSYTHLQLALPVALRRQHIGCTGALGLIQQAGQVRLLLLAGEGTVSYTHLFLFLSILEDCGYMVRIAFVMDRIFRHFGLSGKSFIPLMISSGCGVPGIMASKTCLLYTSRCV